MQSNIGCIMELLNNTFIGTLSAGLILTILGFHLYKREKQVDIEFEDLRKLRDTAATLFAGINSATGKIGGLFNMYNQQNPVFTKILQHVGGLIEEDLNQKIGKELEVNSAEIAAHWEDLSSQLAIKNKFDVKVDVIGQNMVMINMYMNGASITLHKLKPKEVEEWRKGWDNARASIVAELNKILK